MLASLALISLYLFLATSLGVIAWEYQFTRTIVFLGRSFSQTWKLPTLISSRYSNSWQPTTSKERPTMRDLIAILLTVGTYLRDILEELKKKAP